MQHGEISSIPHRSFDRLTSHNLLYEDHNMGGLTAAANIEFWVRKMDWINSAEQAADEILSAAIASLSSELGHPEYSSVAVFNGSDSRRSDYVMIDVAGQNLPDPASYALVDAATGEDVKSQTTFDGSYVFFAENIPANGYKLFSFDSPD
jgi:hypothetical protein